MAIDLFGFEYDNLIDKLSDDFSVQFSDFRILPDQREETVCVKRL